MNLAQVFVIFRKELRDLLRDRRTVISMIVVPVALMPLLMLGAGYLTQRTVQKARATAPTVMVIGGEDSPRARAALEQHPGVQLTPFIADWRQRISDKKLRAAVRLSPGFDVDVAEGKPASVTIYSHEGELRSEFAAAELRRVFADHSSREIADRLAARGLPRSFIRPFDIKTENVAPPEKVAGNAFGGLLPYFFLLLSFTAAMYPAIDLTAGEKERGTLETLLCSPAGRTEIVFGKFLMVLTASLTTVLCSLLSTLVSAGLVAAMFSPELLGQARATRVTALPINPLGLLMVVGMAVPMSVLFSAVQFSLGLFARSYKEAQSYISPLLGVILLPAFLGMLPGMDLSPGLALVPILNVSLVSKELVAGVWHWDLIALIFGSSCVYAAVALTWAVRLFNREDVLFRS